MDTPTGRVRVVVVDQRPAVAAVADKGVGLPSARHLEIGFDAAHKGRHAGEGSLGILENRCAVVLPPNLEHSMTGGGRGGSVNKVQQNISSSATVAESTMK